MKQEDYKFAADIVLTLKTNIVKENLIKVIRALKYGEWVKSGNHCVANDYKGLRISIDTAKNKIICYTDFLPFVFDDKGKVNVMTDWRGWLDRPVREYVESIEEDFNSRDALEVENTSKLVSELLAVAAEKKDCKTKEVDYKLAVDMLPDLKTDLIKGTLAKVLGALKSNKPSKSSKFSRWDKWDSHLSTEYDYTSIFIDVDFKYISVIVVEDELSLNIHNDGEVEVEWLQNDSIWKAFAKHLEDFFNSRDALEVENTGKLVNKILDVAGVIWLTL
jgi:hypothetical protein|nr:MAG TPA: hypothetical protein [Caudoviricetes sp.]